MIEDLSQLRVEWYKYKSLLYDQSTGLPTFPAILDEIRKLLEKEKVIGLCYLNIGEQDRIEPIFGWELYDDLIKSFTISILGQIGKVVPPKAIIAISSIRGDGFFIFLSSSIVGCEITKDYMQNLVQRFEKVVQEMKITYKNPEIKERINFFCGYEIIRIDPMIRIERLVYQAAENAKYAAHFREMSRERDLYTLLERIIYNKLITIVYQPIYKLDSNVVFGYEALTRGPEGSYFEDPDIIFSFAAKVNLLQPMEEICLKKAIADARLLPNGARLFLNVTPSLATTLITDELINDMKNSGLNLERVVIELTERIAIPDYEIYRGMIVRIKAKGFEISLDDVGTGYSTLERIAEMSPNYLKYDKTLVRNIDRDLIRQELIKSVRDFADKIKTKIIVEGIENSKELEFVKKIGIRYGQGFYLGSPAALCARAS